LNQDQQQTQKNRDCGGCPNKKRRIRGGCPKGKTPHSRRFFCVAQ
jgi:hypothetical protein